MEQIGSVGENWQPPGCGQLLQLAQHVRVESGRRAVGEKETRDRMKVKDRTRGLKTSWIKSPVPWSPITFISCLGNRKNLLCCMKSASCVPGHVSHFINYFKLLLLFFCTRAVT